MKIKGLTLISIAVVFACILINGCTKPQKFVVYSKLDPNTRFEEIGFDGQNSIIKNPYPNDGGGPGLEAPVIICVAQILAKMHGFEFYDLGEFEKPSDNDSKILVNYFRSEDKVKNKFLLMMRDEKSCGPMQLEAIKIE